MDTKTALKAVDMYFKYLEEGAPYNPIRRPSIGFYGGEPLINFKLIKEVVNYIEDTYPDYNVIYTLTTNATLLKPEVARFLAEKGFGVFVSIDGPLQEHDRNRVYPGGSGTFNVVYRNVKRFRAMYPYHYLYALAVYDAYTNLSAVKEFFDNNDTIRLIRIDKVREYFIKEEHAHITHINRNLAAQLIELRKNSWRSMWLLIVTDPRPSTTPSSD